MNRTMIRKKSLHDPAPDRDLSGLSPGELLGMMWQLALDAWSFKVGLNVEPRLQRHIVVLKRGKG